ncbi:amidohydrolase [Salinivirga cyanobacteriivorans]
MDKLRVTLMQWDLIWEDPAANRLRFSEQFEFLKGKTDLVILPEMFTTGFSMSPEKVAETWPGESVEWLRKEAVRFGFVICGSTMIKDGERFYNRFVWADARGNIEFNDKRHLFQMGGEHEVYSPGNQQIVINFGGWRIAPFICYDLRFPVWTRNRNNYDLAIYVANWPAVRHQVWEKLLLARAIENQCYVAGVNRVGTDGRELKYSGNSYMINPRGEIALDFVPGIEEAKTVEISLNELNAFREKFPVMTDADDFEIKI